MHDLKTFLFILSLRIALIFTDFVQKNSVEKAQLKGRKLYTITGRPGRPNRPARARPVGSSGWLPHCKEAPTSFSLFPQQ